MFQTHISCSAGCPPLTTPSNGVVDPISNRMLGPGATVTLFCNDGFMPTEPVTATCMDSLMWGPNPITFVCDPVTTIGEEGYDCMKSLFKLSHTWLTL